MDNPGDREIMWVSCPMDGNVVRADHICASCPHWNGERCKYYDKGSRRTLPGRKPYQSRPKKPRGGGGVRVPPVWEKWPYNIDNDDPLQSGGYENKKPAYGLAGSLENDEEPDPKQKPQKEGEEEGEEENKLDYHEPFLFDPPDSSIHPEIEVVNEADEPDQDPDTGLSQESPGQSPPVDQIPPLPDPFPGGMDDLGKPGISGPDPPIDEPGKTPGISGPEPPPDLLDPNGGGG